MKLRCSQKDLALALSIVNKAVSPNNTLPVLNNILIKAEGSKLLLSATNLEIALHASIDAVVEKEGALTVPAKVLSSYVSLLNDENVELALTELIQWYKKNKKKIHPLILAFEFHKRYEEIHPFLDGNGRTGRLIMNKILISSGYQPIIVYKDNKLAYFNTLAKAKEGRIKNYYQFMLEQTIKTYDFLEEVTKKY